jgi:hypothetical protein
LLLTIFAGFIGSPEPADNIAMTLFWVLFLLGFAYLTLFVGDLYALISPWKWVVEGLERCRLDLSSARIGYPQRLGYWPALLFYAALIWIELRFWLELAWTSAELCAFEPVYGSGLAYPGVRTARWTYRERLLGAPGGEADPCHAVSVMMSQLPLLALMLVYTALSLWTLSLPLGAE